MKVRLCCTVALLLQVVLVGCHKPETVSKSSSAAANQLYLNEAQARLPTVKLWLGSQELLAEIAKTPTQVATGMMFRKEIAENEAMLFVFARPYQASFYMRNTIVPLSCAYIDSEGVILEVHNLKPLDETPVEAASTRVQFVLETKQGWFERNNIALGSVVRTEHGSLADTFLASR